MNNSMHFRGLSSVAWADLKDRLRNGLPDHVGLTLQHAEHGIISCGSVDPAEQLTLMPGYASISCAITCKGGRSTRNMITKLVENYIEYASEVESLSQELVGTYSDIALLDELGRILPRCDDRVSVARELANVVGRRIDGLGCIVAESTEQQTWQVLEIWGGALSGGIDSNTELSLHRERGRWWTNDTGPLPRSLGHGMLHGSHCIIPMQGPEGCEGLLIMGRTHHEPFSSNECKLLEMACGLGAAHIYKLRHAETLQNARVLNRELELAAQIQKRLLPLSIPDLGTLRIDGRLRAARHIGGDYYDVIEDNGTVYAVIADVSGHNIPAALAMNMFRTALRTAIPLYTSPARLLQSLNRQLVPDLLRSQLFVSAAVIAINPKNGEMRYASAGHPPIMLRDVHGELRSHDPDGVILGMLEEADFEEIQECLAPGESCLLYTDGITEARRGEEHYGPQRLSNTFLEAKDEPSAMLSFIESELQRWLTATQFDDDITLLALHHKP